VLSTAARMVQWFTRRTVRECPGLDAAEVQGEMWVAAVEAMKFWKQDGGAAFSTILFQRLTWSKGHFRRRWVQDHRMRIAHFEEMVEQPDPGFEDRWKRLVGRLKEDEQQVLELMVSPSPVFLRYVHQCWHERRSRWPGNKISYTVQQVHYARFLGLSTVKVGRTIRHIQRLTQEVFNDNER